MSNINIYNLYMLLLNYEHGIKCINLEKCKKGLEKCVYIEKPIKNPKSN